jgi:hypothetical protein
MYEGYLFLQFNAASRRIGFSARDNAMSLQSRVHSPFTMKMEFPPEGLVFSSNILVSKRQNVLMEALSALLLVIN